MEQCTWFDNCAKGFFCKSIWIDNVFLNYQTIENLDPAMRSISQMKKIEQKGGFVKKKLKQQQQTTQGFNLLVNQARK